SRTTTWVFRAGPVVGLAAVLAALALVPFGGAPAVVAFPGDLLLFAYLLGLARFATVAAALDAGSSFEGMGPAARTGFRAWPSRRCCWRWRPWRGRRIGCPFPACTPRPPWRCGAGPA